MRITWPVMAGVVCREFYGLPDEIVLCLFLACFLWVLMYVLPVKFSQTLSIKYNTAFGTCITVCLFCAGFLYTSSRRVPVPEWPENKEVLARVTLSDSPLRREKSYRVEADVSHLCDGKTFPDSPGKMLLYFSKEINCQNWQPGDVLLLRLKPDRIKGPANPGEFDLQTYNRRKGIFYRAFINPGQVLAHRATQNRNIIHRIGRYMMSRSEKHLGRSPEKALADALVLGYQDDLDEETVERYSRSGTSHVLAVSGLHVGILWLVIDRMLFFMNRKKWMRVSKFFLSIGVLWGYAILTGLSPSVMRAAIMFSCFAAGGIMKHGYHSINILCFSAWLQMLVDPYVIFNAGFQLSYAAVAGILVFHKPFKHAVYFRQKWLRYLWEMVSLTLAAQLATAPVSLYWFGQFPTWFAFSNLPIVPLSGLALQLGLAAYVLEWIPYVGPFLFRVFSWSIRLMDLLADFFSELPLALLYFHVDFWDAVLLYILIVLLSLFIAKKRPVWFKSVVALTCVYLAFDGYREWQIASTENWVFYRLKKGTAIRHHQGHHAHEFVSGTVDEKSYGFSVKPSDRKFNTKKRIHISAYDGFISMGNRHIVLLQPKHLKRRLPQQVTCDWLLVESMRFIDFEMLSHNFRFDKLFIGSGNSHKSRGYWKRECIRRKIPFYDLKEAGAYFEPHEAHEDN